MTDIAMSHKYCFPAVETEGLCAKSGFLPLLIEELLWQLEQMKHLHVRASVTILLFFLFYFILF